MCSELAINVTRYLRPHSPRKSTQGFLLSGSVDVMEGLVYCSAVAILKLCLTWPVLFAGPARSCSSGVAVRELQQVQADTPVTHVSLSKAGFCPGWDQRAPLSLSSSLLASQSMLHLLCPVIGQGSCLAEGQGRKRQCLLPESLPSSPASVLSFPGLLFSSSGLEAGSRPGAPLPFLGDLPSPP